jgi:hypothetical protein
VAGRRATPWPEAGVRQSLVCLRVVAMGPRPPVALP